MAVADQRNFVVACLEASHADVVTREAQMNDLKEEVRSLKASYRVHRASSKARKHELSHAWEAIAELESWLDEAESRL